MDIDTLARTGRLDDKKVVAYLDGLDGVAILPVLGHPDTVMEIHGDPWTGERPALADEDPAVNAAIARCSIARWRGSGRFESIARTASHPGRCGWCDYPPEELDRALRWGQAFGRYIVSDDYVWRRDGRRYRRSARRLDSTGEKPRQYDNDAWQAFAERSPGDQKRAVDDAVRRARPADGEHDPWCALPPDHAGPCPDPT